jgi:uncharacterized membrane protein
MLIIGIIFLLLIVIGITVAIQERAIIQIRQAKVEKELAELKSKVAVETKLLRQEMLKKLDSAEM